MKTQRERKLEIVLLKEKLERISNKKVLFKEKEDILVPRNLDTRDEKYKQKILKLLQQKIHDGDLDLSDLPLPFELKDLGNLERVNGHLDLRTAPIKDLGNLERVNRWLYVHNTPITSLGNLEYVGDDLNLYNTPIKDLGNLKVVKGTLWISKEQEGKIKGLEKFNYKFWA